MAETYYRVQSGDRDPQELLDPEFQTSQAWGHQHLEDRTSDREGVSACASREDLATYLAGPGSGIPYGQPGWVLVEMRGEVSAARPLDAEFGEVLIHPTEIVAVGPIDDDLFAMIGDAYDALEV